ncbi:flavin-containing monooxygenase [Mycolicibacterium confluentis]|uniref:Steroid monooxygenase n=1 Tax=Mycolicibacterium confluentis TaxID=28047 RepID=A0A7I7XXG3_9MYCO|nr:alpha/beta hydrolase fold domain-containing protein [Mycolicibacterium confluentis]MCV7318440.1 alpha/beta hydrolase fold domain-containing protein [Mycolicibacterium confluentis]ORV20266.1 steroid monooxygenase [Mycolicibacterium confluentis]BBZ34020.1 steroid monooxygenase [Mycolicibacterium confluentis]
MTVPTTADVIVVGAGAAGLYAVHRLRRDGFSVRVLESADDLGGTWFWNRYPGARVDIPSVDYMYSFDPDWRNDWQWSEKYATQPEILRYLNHIADKFDLRRDIAFDTRVRRAVWDDQGASWHIDTDRGACACRHLVMATGCLSTPKDPDIAGVDRFRGETLFTSRWPHHPVDFSGRRVAVVGTGSSGIQSIPLIAEQARELVVFQRTPSFSLPAHNGPLAPERVAQLDDEAEYREAARYSRGGVPQERSITPTMSVSAEERTLRYERAWQIGELLETMNVYADVLSNPEANHQLAEFFRGKIRATVTDPETAELLCPTRYPIGAKRICLDTDYHATFNRPNVRLVDLRRDPLETVTETGIDTRDESFEFDTIVFATGFDALTGALAAIDIRGRDGQSLKDKWAAGPSTYLGLTSAGFPNLFLVTGPGSPSVLSNMMVSIEQHVDLVADLIGGLRSDGLDTIEPTARAEAGWMQHVQDCADISLFPQADSWYMGANVPGKPRVFLPYAAGVDSYRNACDDMIQRDFLGFKRSGPAGTVCKDGVVRRLQPDVQAVLEEVAALNLPPLESLSPAGARAGFAEANTQRPPGPEVGEIVDASFPGPAGDLDYRLYRPASAGPHPVLVYFHGGGWVLGDARSDDPLCRDLCVRTDAVVVSVDYRHGPEHRFPAAIEDSFAAVRWAAENAAELGGTPGPIAVAGWSAGAGNAAVVCQLARDAGGPEIAVQVLVAPVADADTDRPSYAENGTGYDLDATLMQWFFDHYSDPAVRTDPRIAPLRAADLTGLPPAVVVTCEFDVLRDGGTAYAEALAAAGVRTEHIRARGHTHCSLTMVDVVLSGVPVREELATAFRQLAKD